MLTSEQRQDLRHAVLHFLAKRRALVFTAASIGNMLRSRRMLDFAASDQDVAAACDFHVDLGHLTRMDDRYGATVYYQATATGELASERERRDLGEG